MKLVRFMSAIIVGAVMTYGFALRSEVRGQGGDQLRTPAKDSAERKAIVDAVHEAYKEGADQPAKFLVNYLKVHNGWAWINVTPLDDRRKAGSRSGAAPFP
jgi:hypothetical protein